MRRKDRERDKNFAYDIIDKCEYGTLAISDEESKPYCIPLSFVRIDNNLYFHCATEGRKIELLQKNPNVCVSFASDVKAAYISDKNSFTTSFKSAIVKGIATEVTDTGDKIKALRALCEKLLPDNMERFDKAAEKSLAITKIWRIDIQDITGKERSI